MAHGTLNIYELAQRVIDVDFYGARDAGETVESIAHTLQADPLTIVDGLLSYIEENDI